jgi:hypothetical protein
VKEKIRELAKSPSLSATYIKNEIHKYSHTLVDHLNIGQDSTQFFPNEPAIKKIMRHFRGALRLDPHDHIACSMYIEQDEAANPGPRLVQVMLLHTSKPQSISCFLCCHNSVLHTVFCREQVVLPSRRWPRSPVLSPIIPTHPFQPSGRPTHLF